MCVPFRRVTSSRPRWLVYDADCRSPSTRIAYLPLGRPPRRGSPSWPPQVRHRRLEAARSRSAVRSGRGSVPACRTVSTLASPPARTTRPQPCPSWLVKIMWSACLYVCPFVCPLTYLTKPHVQISPIFFWACYILPWLSPLWPQWN